MASAANIPVPMSATGSGSGSGGPSSSPLIDMTPGHALGDAVEASAAGIGAGLPETGDGAVDDARVGVADGLVTQAQTGGGAGPPVLDHDLGLRGQAARHGETVEGLEIDDDAALVAVDGHEGRRLTGQMGSARAHLVAVTGPLDLDDIGAEVAEEHGAVRPGELTGEIENTQAVERAGSHGSRV